MRNFNFVKAPADKKAFEDIQVMLKNGLYDDVMVKAKRLAQTGMSRLYSKMKWEKPLNYSLFSYLQPAQAYRTLGREHWTNLSQLNNTRNTIEHADKSYTEEDANKALETVHKLYARVMESKEKYQYIETKTDAEEYAESLTAKEKEIAEARAAVGKFQAKAEKLEEEAKKPKHNVRIGFKVNW